ncbi:HECT-domain-containing protein [Testicularia cyperi]|uniref:HECT-type E3 ubiquitin transferase n=1 Tax=Testicularia cyperi TaxID=1882483 RepID=A0A317XZ83_9BASI|nr:HECT-domain-containing protein [Testicularia cyperi]
MNFNFTGSTRGQRDVNLGGTSSNGIDPARKARQERLEREQLRIRQNAAVRIQSQVRRISQSQVVRRQCYEELDTLLAQVTAPSVSAHDSRLITATRSMLIAAGPSSRRPTAEDQKYFSRWVEVMTRPVDGKPLMLLPLQDLSNRWLRLLGLACKYALRLLSMHNVDVSSAGSDPGVDVSVLTFLGLLVDIDTNSPAQRVQTSPSGVTLPATLVDLSLRNGLHHSIRSYILSFAPNVKAPAATVGVAIKLALAPFALFKTVAPSALTPSSGTSLQDAMIIDDNDEPEELLLDPLTRAVVTFTEEILTIPLLRKRLPLSAVTDLATRLPFDAVLELVISTKEPQNTAESAFLRTPHFLANFLAFGSARVSFIKSGKDLNRYLEALNVAQSALPLAVFQRSTLHTTAPSAYGHAIGSDVQTEGKSAIASKRASESSTYVETYSRLAIVVSDNHISTIVSISNRFPNSTRPQLFAFFCIVLSSWPSDIGDHVLNRLLFSDPSSAVTGKSGSSDAQHAATPVGSRARKTAGPAGTALIREYWRGHVRGSTLTKELAATHSGTRARDFLSTLSGPQFAEEWPGFVLLANLLSKVLLTLSDDEFYSKQGMPGATAAANAGTWLTAEEIISISGILRNVAFAMYWHEGKAPLINMDETSATGIPAGKHTAQLADAPQVPGMRMTIPALRALVTKVLQQFHARDSRRKFAPLDHWLMVSQLDLKDFITTVVLEERHLSSEQDEDEDLVGSEAVSARSGTFATLGAPQNRSNTELMGDGEDMDEVMSSDRSLGNLRQLRAQGRRSQHLTASNLAFLSPRLGILNNVPFLIPFDVRVEIFAKFIMIDAEKIGVYRDRWVRRAPVKIRRSHVAQDGFAMLNPLGAQLKHPIQIVFIDDFGQAEAGIDGGGLFKEFLTSLVREAFDTDRGLWKASDSQEIYPNPHSYARSKEQLEWFTFLGRVIGLALYEGILVNVKFAGFFLSKMLGKQSYLDDLGSIDSLDKELYRGLISLKNYDGNVEDLSLIFTVDDEEFGVRNTIELVPGGANIPVTNLNRMEYIYRISHYRLTTQIAPQCQAFFSGLAEMIHPRWLRSFNREELSILISGTEDPVDIDDLKKNTIYSGFSPDDLTIQYFWSALESFDQTRRGAFLKFVTSSPRPPLLGFAQLNPKFAIRNAGADTSRLPTASTCVNLLKLPAYTTPEICRQKLLYAIESGAGFDLS